MRASSRRPSLSAAADGASLPKFAISASESEDVDESSGKTSFAVGELPRDEPDATTPGSTRSGATLSGTTTNARSRKLLAVHYGFYLFLIFLIPILKWRKNNSKI